MKKLSLAEKLKVLSDELAEITYELTLKRKYITETNYKNIKEKADSLSKLLNAFIKKLAASS